LRLLSAVLLAVIVLTPAGMVWGGQREVEERLACQCGCGLTVHTCNHLQCSFAVPVREDIAKSLAAGQAEDEIIARYVAEYGEKVLSAPTREGFNLLAWWGPYAALVGGAFGLWFAIRRLNRRQGDEFSDAAPVGDIPQSARDEINRELERLEP
jgi:cytochrome c-type biogenesis protein CcmH/NrfF